MTATPGEARAMSAGAGEGGQDMTQRQAGPYRVCEWIGGRWVEVEDFAYAESMSGHDPVVIGPGCEHQYTAEYGATRWQDAKDEAAWRNAAYAAGVASVESSLTAARAAGEEIGMARLRKELEANTVACGKLCLEARAAGAEEMRERAALTCLELDVDEQVAGFFGVVQAADKALELADAAIRALPAEPQPKEEA